MQIKYGSPALGNNDAEDRDPKGAARMRRKRKGKDQIRRWKTTMFWRTSSIIARNIYNSEQFKRENKEGSPEGTTRSRSQLRAARDEVIQEKILDQLRNNQEDSSKRCYCRSTGRRIVEEATRQWLTIATSEQAKSRQNK